MRGSARVTKPAGDSRAHFFYKRAKRLAGTAGTAAEHRERIAELTIG
jgi:general stress protein YciG